MFNKVLSFISPSNIPIHMPCNMTSKYLILSWAYWYRPVTQAHGRQRQESHRVKSSLGYKVMKKKEGCQVGGRMSSLFYARVSQRCKVISQNVPHKNAHMRKCSVYREHTPFYHINLKEQWANRNSRKENCFCLFHDTCWQMGAVV